MIISVTQKHIDSGFRGSCDKDPVALALKDSGFKKVWISPDRVILDGVEYEMPEVVSKFIRDFDNVRFVDPFEFEIGPEELSG